MNIEQILSEVLILPTSTRAFIAEKILETLDNDEPFTLSAEWQVEVNRRITEIDAGEVEMVAAPDVFAQIRKDL
jgi:putative addiction module component (TIGR02574 family)